MLICKNFVFAAFLFFYPLLNACAQEYNYKVTENNGKEKLLGIITKEGLTSSSFQSWFNKEYHIYQVDSAAIRAAKPEFHSYTIKAFMGTWCGDSKREVPRFYKILKASDFPMEKLLMVAVDYIKPNYKKSPGGEEKGLNIIKVPTFIFFKDGKEVNRIIESPVVSLEKDIYEIIKQKSYVPNYSNMPVLPVD